MRIARQSRSVTTRRSAARAFTMVEMVVVMVLLAILAAVTIPAVANLTRWRASAATQQLARDLTYTRQQAIARGVTMWVVLSTASDSYSILAESVTAPGLANASTITDPATGQPFVQTLGAGEFGGVDLLTVSIGGAGGTHLAFDWQGRPMDSSGTLLASDSTITLTGGNTVTVSGVSGFVTVSP